MTDNFASHSYTESPVSADYVRPSIEIDGQLKTDIAQGLLEVQVTLPLSGMAHLQLRLVNWQSNDNDPLADFAFLDLALGQEIALLIQAPQGQQGAQTEPVFKGEITALEERYGNGAPQIVVLAEDALHRLAKKRNNRVFEEMSINQIIDEIAGDHRLSANSDVSTQIHTWHQINETDMAFLKRLVKPFDLAVRIVAGELRIKAEESDPQAILIDPQSNADSVRIIADLNRQVESIKVHGFNLDNDDELQGTVGSPQPTALGTSAVDELAKLNWGAQEIAVQHFARDQTEADSWAQGAMNARAKRFLYGDISCRGDARLTCGKEIKLQGVSKRLLGIYQVVQCQHLYNAEIGFRTDLKVERSSW